MSWRWVETSRGMNIRDVSVSDPFWRDLDVLIIELGDDVTFALYTEGRV